MGNPLQLWMSVVSAIDVEHYHDVSHSRTKYVSKYPKYSLRPSRHTSISSSSRLMDSCSKLLTFHKKRREN